MSTSTLPISLTGSLLDTSAGSAQSLPDAATGLVHLGNGRYYDPAIGRPLQPNPAGVPPTMPQALNRYTAAAAGQPGVLQATQSSGWNIPPNSIGGVIGNAYLEYMGRTRVVGEQIVGLSLQGTRPALRTALAGSGLPVDVTTIGTKGGKWGLLAIDISDKIPFWGNRIQQGLIDRLRIYQVTTRNAGVFREVGHDRFYSQKYGTTINTAGLQTTVHRGPVFLREVRGLRTAAGLGLSVGIDLSLELFGAATGTGRWGNPYWTTQQKYGQARLEIGSAAVIAGGLLLAGATWYVTIPVALAWSYYSPQIFAALPGTSQFYNQNRNLRPLQQQ